MATLSSGHSSNTSFLSVIQISHLFHSSLMLSLLSNFMLLPKNPFFDRKNNVAGFDLPNSSNPINVKLCS